MNIFEISKLLARGNKDMFDIPVREQYIYMNSLKAPKNNFERSYNQFLCQEFFVPIWKRCLWWVISIIALPIAVLFFWLKGRSIHFISEIDTIAEKKGMDEILPDELTSKYNINHDVWFAGTGLSSVDIKFLLMHVIGWRQPYFMLKITLLISVFSPRITKYHPKQLIEHSEYSFGSSIITEYCHSRGVKHINVQHGEKLRYIRDAFFCFDECYVWDEYYVNLFKELHADPAQFIVSVPPSLRIDCSLHKNVACYADAKYYLAADNESEITSIVSAMNQFKKDGKKIKYRIHPRYTDVNILRKYVDEDEIEYPSNVNIIDSVSNTSYAVGSYTTVLLQAHLAGVKVVLNDVTYRERYSQLKEYGYILANKNVKKLSDFCS